MMKIIWRPKTVIQIQIQDTQGTLEDMVIRRRRIEEGDMVSISASRTSATVRLGNRWWSWGRREFRRCATVVTREPEDWLAIHRNSEHTRTGRSYSSNTFDIIRALLPVRARGRVYRIHEELYLSIEILLGLWRVIAIHELSSVVGWDIGIELYSLYLQIFGYLLGGGSFVHPASQGGRLSLSSRATGEYIPNRHCSERLEEHGNGNEDDDPTFSPLH